MKDVKTLRKIRIDGHFAYVPLTQGYEAIIDADDVHLVEKWNWAAQVTRKRNGEIGNIYAFRKSKIMNAAKRIYMHRVVFNAPIGMEVDHINGYGLDNRKSNLRSATRAQNAKNQGLSIANTSGIKGVYWHKPSKKWRAIIRSNGKQITIGNYPSLEGAREAYRSASLRLHGEFGRLE